MDVVADFGVWAAGRPDIDVDVGLVETVVRLKDVYCGDPDPRRWQPDNLDQLLLYVLPDRVKHEPGWFGGVLSTMETYLRWLDENRLLHQKGDDLEGLLDELEVVAETFVELAREAAEDAAPPLQGESFPAVRGHPTAELAAAAVACTTLTQVAALARWAGDGRSDSGDEGSAALPGVDAARRHQLWTIAVALEWVTVTVGIGGAAWEASEGETARRWAAADDEERVHLWTAVFAHIVLSGYELGRDDVLPAPWSDAFTTFVLAGVLCTLYTEGSEDVEATVAAHLSGPIIVDTEARAALPGWLEQEVDLLADLGAVQRTGTTASVTPLGTAGINQYLVALGADAPMLDPQTLSSADLMTLAADVVANDELFAAWTAARGGPVEAARDLLGAAAAAGTSVARITALRIVDAFIGADAWPAIAQFADDPLLGPHVRDHVSQAGAPGTAPISEADRVFLLIDQLAGYLYLLEPPVRADDLTAGLWALAEPLVAEPQIWTALHPDLLHVLDAVGSGHPQGRVRRVAKKAAHKARTLTDTQTG